MRNESPVSDASDGIERHAGMSRQKNNREHGSQQAVTRFAPESRAGRRRMEEKRDEGIQDRPQHQSGDNPAPQHWHRREKPARQEEGKRGWRHQTTAQIVENLPAVEGGKR